MTILGIAVILIGLYRRSRPLIRAGSAAALLGFVMTAGADLVTHHDVGALVEAVAAGLLILAVVAYALRRRRVRKPARA